MDKKLLDILACPACKSGLKYLKEEQELVCMPCRLAYPVRDDIPIMLIDEARKLSSEEADKLR
ncbi:MAG: Trm112 family protein [Cycloclasticus sp.]|nr:Trm112 family protein [Cycloclasticus sp.]